MFVIAFSSCTTYRVTNSQKTFGEKINIKNLECSTTSLEEVDVFYKKDSIDFKYEEVGYVTAYANSITPDSLIIKRLQYNSYLLCGNAVKDVYLTKTIKDGENIKQYNGVSIIIDKDSLYYNKYPFEADYSFFEFATSDYTSQIEETTAFGKVMIGVVGIIVIIIALLGDDEDEEFEEVILFE